jgi:hypothetical protein
MGSGVRPGPMAVTFVVGSNSPFLGGLMEVRSSSVRAVLYLNAADLPAVAGWHDAAEASLLPLVQPPGAPAVAREVTGSTRAADGSGGPIGGGPWVNHLVPDLYQLQTIWSYGDSWPRGPVQNVDVRVHRPHFGVFFSLDLLVVLSDSAALPAVCDAVLAVVRETGKLSDPVYGELLVNRIPRSPSTALDRLLRRNPVTSLKEGRRFLRGYEWTTICPAEIAKTLGGADVLRASGAFAEVTELGRGGLLLRATEDPAEWNDDAVRRVFEAVRPALPPGQPRQPQFETITNVVMSDAHSAS